MSTQASPIHEDQPRPGWYKLRYDRNGKWQPVAIWRAADGRLLCKVGKDDAEAAKVWTWCADNKVTKEAAKHAFEKGFWPDEMPPVQLSNLPADPFEALKIEIDAQQTRAEDWLKGRPTITTHADSDLARNMQAELLKLNKRADALFTAEKAPILEATRACDDKYRFRAAVKEVAERLRKVFGAFMAAEEERQKAEAVAKFKAEQARVAAERAKIEAAAKKEMEDNPIAALTSPPPEMPQLPLAPEPVKVQSGGGVGRKAGLKTVWGAVIEDYSAALAHFAEHPDIRSALDRLTTHAVRDSKGTAKIPGVRIVETRVPA